MRDWEPIDPDERRGIHREAAVLAAIVAFIALAQLWRWIAG